MCEKKSDREIREALEDLPQSLPETFERILRQFTKSDDIRLGRHIFRWVAVAKRPLTIDELQDAIATEPLQKSWDPKRFVNSMMKAMACCGNLVFLDEEHQTVHFTHGSVKQHLISHAVSQSLQPYQINLEDANAEAGAACVTYLHFPLSGTQVARRADLSRHLVAIPPTVLKNSLPSGISGNKIALRLLKPGAKSRKSLHRLLEDLSGDTEVHRQQAVLRRQSFRPYAEQFWLEHTNRRIDPDSSKELWTLWRSLIDRAQLSKNLSGVPWTFEDWENHATTVMMWILEHNHCSMAQLLVFTDTVPYSENPLLLIEGAAARGHSALLEICLKWEDVPKVYLHDALRAAAKSGSLDVVNQLLAELVRHNWPTEDTGEVLGATALQAAAGGGHFTIVEALLHAGANVNAPADTHDGRTALQAAVEGGHRLLVERLLDEKADVNAVAAIFRGRTALQVAAENNHLDLIEILLQRGANINAPACRRQGRTALQAASERGHMHVIERLLDENLKERANVNAPPSETQGRTALQAAVEGGHFEVIDRLLNEGADVNVNESNSYGIEALLAAAGSGYLDVVEKLLHAGADVNANTNLTSGRKALVAAAESGHLAVVERLLLAGAEMDFPDPIFPYRTALQAAAEGGFLEIVRRLVERGADVCAPSPYSEGLSALEAAATGGFLNIVDFLIDNGANVNETTAKHREFSSPSPLQGAAAGGHLEVVNTLIRRGATINLVSGKGDKTALEAAIENGQLAVADRLRAAGTVD